ncbi:DUF1294 domain-containing protein [Pelagibaculum spongiae]|uniref:DUF1294 domain-containing protein n=1 Tax=Pelagibaculum spongiae TaxID=2080658 RepID=A0A2V1GW76_9GAMM|nr:cold shock and DUF1294 domain-containing protein [Pelagibaculum spongiae]PVZ70588.1 DUF1294 domain-containing protein [Pelagibaculum spongiae]
MRLKGKLSNWNDQKGYGFVEPLSGGQRVFVHIKAFANRHGKRPADGDLIVYQQVKESSGRYSAVDVQFSQILNQAASRAHLAKNRSNKTNWWGEVAIALLLTMVSYTIYTVQLPWQAGLFYLAASFITFVFYAIDKSAAQAGRWRTQESTLHTLALFGGWPGGYIAQKTLRHKSSKKEFQTVFWITVFLNFIVLLWLLSEQGNGLLRNIIYQITVVMN